MHITVSAIPTTINMYVSDDSVSLDELTLKLPIYIISTYTGMKSQALEKKAC